MTETAENSFAALDQRAPKSKKNRKQQKEDAETDATAPRNAVVVEGETESPNGAETNGWSTSKKPKKANGEESKGKSANKRDGRGGSAGASQTARNLESAAMSKDAAERTETWNSWIESLKDSNATYRDERTGSSVPFVQLFTKSNVLEMLCESLVQSWNNASEPLLQELFSLSLDGSKQDHQTLITQIRKLSQAYHGQKPPPVVGKIVWALVDGFKCDTSVAKDESDLESTIKRLDADIARQESKLQGGEDTLDKGAVHKDIVGLCSQKRKLLTGGPDSLRSADAVEHTFSNFTSEVSRELERVHKSQTDVVKKREQITAERKQIENKSTDSLKTAEKNRKAVDDEEATLKKRKAELEAELEKVKTKLKGMQRRRDDADRALEEAKMHNQARLKTLEDREEVLKCDAKRFEDDSKSLASLQEFLKSTHTVMTRLRGNQDQEASSATVSACKQHLRAVNSYLAYQQRAMEMLHQRLDFCSKKVTSAQKEKADMASSGLADLAQDLNQVINKLKQTQATTTTELRRAKQYVDKAMEGVNPDMDKDFPEFQHIRAAVNKIEKLVP
eukprot:Rmarinus@m.17516